MNDKNEKTITDEGLAGTLAPHNDVKQFSSDKILKHLDRVNEWIDGKNPAPITMELDMTNVCNHRCPECVVDYFQLDDNNSLPQKDAERIIDQLAEAGVRGLIFTGGGEPLVHPATLAMVERVRGHGMDVGFITNGQLIKEESAEILVKNCVWTRVSLDAGSPEVFQKTHGVKTSSYNKVLEGIGLLVKKKRELGSDCTIGVGFLTCKESKMDMEPATILCKNLGVDYIQFRPMQIHHGGKFTYDWEEVHEQIEKCQAHATGAFDVLHSQHKYEMMKRQDYGRDYDICHGHQFASTITATGEMYICCHLRGYEKYSLGNLKKNSFTEIWNSAQRKKAHEGIDFKDCIPLCRCNTFNQVLWNLTQPKNHLNFI